MTRAETIQGLERGLQVLQLLQSNPILSLHEIHVATGISKPSLLRILHTLERFGLVSRRLGDGRYRIGANATLPARKRFRYDRVAEAAAPVLDRLCQRISWPSDLLVPAGDHMVIGETSQTHSPFLINVSRIGQPVNWLLSAVGRVYLAFCAEKERQDITERLRKSDKPEDRLAREPERLDAILSETRQRGYGLRDPAFAGGAYGGPVVNDGLAAIATPLCDGKRVHGSVNILWNRASFTTQEFVGRHLVDLRTAASEIVAALQAPKRGERGR